MMLQIYNGKKVISHSYNDYEDCYILALEDGTTEKLSSYALLQLETYNHGGNRQALAQNYGSSLGSAGLSAGGAATGGSILRAYQAQRDAAIQAALIAKYDAYQRAFLQQAVQQQAAVKVVTLQTLLQAIQQFKPTPIPYEGIHPGEIIALRAWRVRGKGLYSMYMKNFKWEPGEEVVGTIKNNYGVHAFKDQPDVNEYINEYLREELHARSYQRSSVLSFVTGRSEPLIFAYGKVALWGEVVEHERGYRAEHARITSIDAVVGVGWRNPEEDTTKLVLELRKTYGVPL